MSQGSVYQFGLDGDLGLLQGHSGALIFQQQLAFTGPKLHITNSERKELGLYILTCTMIIAWLISVDLQ